MTERIPIGFHVTLTPPDATDPVEITVKGSPRPDTDHLIPEDMARLAVLLSVTEPYQGAVRLLADSGVFPPEIRDAIVTPFYTESP